MLQNIEAPEDLDSTKILIKYVTKIIGRGSVLP